MSVYFYAVVMLNDFFTMFMSEKWVV